MVRFKWRYSIAAFVGLAGLSAVADGGLIALRAEIAAAQVALSDADAERLLGQLRGPGPAEDIGAIDRVISILSSDTSVSGMRPLKYANPALTEVALQAYIAVVEQERSYARSIGPKTRAPEGDDEAAAPAEEGGESMQDSLDALAALAESSMSEKLYDYIWDYPQPSPYRRLYVATVCPEKTLERFAGATRGRERDGNVFATEYLFAPGAVLGVSVHQALVHMADIAEFHVELARARRAPLIGFVERYAMFYAPSGEGPHMTWRDYDSREAALRILAVIGGREEISLVRKIADGAPAASPSWRIQNPQDLGALAESVEARITSEG